METIIMILLVGVLLALIVNILYIVSVKKYISQDMIKDMIIAKLMKDNLEGIEIIRKGDKE